MPDWERNWGFGVRIAILIGSLILSILSSKRSFTLRYQDRKARQASRLDHWMAYIPEGWFEMGSDNHKPDEAPAHRVYLDSFLMDRFEVTNLQYQRFIQEAKAEPPRYWQETHFPEGTAFHPVVGISWKEAEAYCKWIGKRLPTEAEWEKACRGESGLVFPWGNQPAKRMANVDQFHTVISPDVWSQAWDYLIEPPNKEKPGLMPVGSFPEGTSPYGIHDLAGNASEWTADFYNWDGYWQVPDRNPLVLSPTWNHVIRGSSWYLAYQNAGGEHSVNRCSARSSSHGGVMDARVGFRCAR